MGPGTPPADRADPRLGDRDPAVAATDHQADGRAADGGLGCGAQRRSCRGRRPSSRHGARPRSRRPRWPPSPGSASRPGADRARPVARPRRRLPLPADGRRRPTPRPPERWTPTSSSGRSTASMPRRSRPGSITSTRSDIASAVTGAIGTMKGPLHGGAPSRSSTSSPGSARWTTPRPGSATRSTVASA